MVSFAIKEMTASFSTDRKSSLSCKKQTVSTESSVLLIKILSTSFGLSKKQSTKAKNQDHHSQKRSGQRLGRDERLLKLFLCSHQGVGGMKNANFSCGLMKCNQSNECVQTC